MRSAAFCLILNSLPIKVDMHANHTDSIEIAGHALDPAHCQMASSEDALRERDDLLVGPVKPTFDLPGQSTTQSDVIGTEAGGDAGGIIASLHQCPELLAGEVAEERMLR